MLAGLISMPILTRILSKEDYGIMSLVFSALTIISTVMAAGFPQATTRLFSEYESKGGDRLRGFVRSMIQGSLWSGMVGVVVTCLVSLGFDEIDQLKPLAPYLRWVCVLILIRVVTGVVLQIFRAEQSSWGYNAVVLANRYLQLTIGICLVVYVFHNVTGIFVATLIVECVVLVVVLIVLNRRGRIGPRVAKEEVFEAMYFGVPLVMADLLTTLVAGGDRFVIQALLNAESVATYGLAYDICEYVGTLLATPIQLALLPVIFNRWSIGGCEETSRFVSVSVRYTLAAVVPVISGFSLVGPELIRLVASDKYSDSGVLVPFLISAVMFCSIQFLFSIGLMVTKKTTVLAWLNLGALVINQSLNWVVIPRLGIVGAAYVAAATYVVLLAATHLVSSRYLPVAIDWLMCLRSCGAAALMGGAVLAMGSISDNLWLSVGTKVVVGASVYLAVLLVLDRGMRMFVLEKMQDYGLIRVTQKPV